MREPEHPRHQRAHVLGRFRVRVLQACDAREDFRERDEEVGGRLHPDCEVWWVVAGAGGEAARGFGVDEVLDYGCYDHAEHGAGEAGLDFLEGCEV